MKVLLTSAVTSLILILQFLYKLNYESIMSFHLFALVVLPVSFTTTIILLLCFIYVLLAVHYAVCVCF